MRIVSMSLYALSRSEIGLVSRMLPFQSSDLGMGLMIPWTRWSGTSPYWMHVVVRRKRKSSPSLPLCFHSSMGIPEGPGALCWPILSRAVLNSSRVGGFIRWLYHAASISCRGS